MWVGGWNRLSSGAGAGVDSCCVDCTSHSSARGSRAGSLAVGGRELDLGLILVLRLELALSLELMLEQVLALELGMELTPALVTELPCLPDDGDGRLELLQLWCWSSNSCCSCCWLWCCSPLMDQSLAVRS